MARAIDPPMTPPMMPGILEGLEDEDTGKTGGVGLDAKKCQAKNAETKKHSHCRSSTSTGSHTFGGGGRC